MRKTLCMLAVIACILVSPSLLMAGSEMDGKEMYLLTNVWFERPDSISSLNFHKGSMLRAGSKVKIKKVTGGSIRFTMLKSPDIEFRIRFSSKYHPGLKCIDYAKLHFSPEDPLRGAEYAAFTPDEKKAVDLGNPIKGISKKAMLMTFGYPPGHKTPSRELNNWYYWTSRWVTRLYRFDRQGRLINPGGR